LIDPSLPAQVLAVRFNERTGLALADVTDVFCTTLRPVHRRGIEAMAGANWWTGPDELEAYREHLQGLSESAERLNAEDLANIADDLKLLKRFRPAPEKFGRQIQLYPLAGPSVGSAGLLLTPPTSTVLIAGDAAATAEHVRRGQVWQGCADVDAATQSLEDLLEIADVIVPGHDNIMLTPQRWF
ncbi:MAG: hypothetical protein KAU28_09465, partial [Phycisphaerae bacterium]|nr:hypothetical protein [Phycisphaerae bacterium]